MPKTTRVNSNDTHKLYEVESSKIERKIHTKRMYIFVELTTEEKYEIFYNVRCRIES